MLRLTGRIGLLSLLRVAMEQKAIELARQACELDREQKYEEALDMYSKALEYFMSAIKCTGRARDVVGVGLNSFNSCAIAPPPRWPRALAPQSRKRPR